MKRTKRTDSKAALAIAALALAGTLAVAWFVPQHVWAQRSASSTGK